MLCPSPAPYFHSNITLSPDSKAIELGGGVEIDWKFGLTIVVGAIGAYARWRPKQTKPTKELSFGILHQSLLMGAADSIADRVGMSFQGELVERVSRVVLSVMNTGQLEIPAVDFERPLAVKLAGVNRLLSTAVIRTSPKNLNPVLTSDRAEVVVHPQLLNPGDFITIELLVDNNSAVVASVDARIVGVSSLPRLRPGKRPGFAWGALMFWGCFTAAVGALTAISLISGTYASGVFSLLCVAIGTFAIVRTVQEIVQVRRSRWMGDETADLAVGERL